MIHLPTSIKSSTTAATILVGLCCISPSLQGEKLHLDDVIRIAAQTTDDKRIIEMDFEIANQDTQIYTSEAYPSLGFRLGTAQGKSAIDLPTKINKIAIAQHEMAFNFKTPVFAFGRIGKLIELRDIQLDINSMSRDLQIQTYISRVIEFYAMTIQKLNLRHIAQQQLNYAQSLLEFTTIEFENGARSKVDFFRTKSNFSSARAYLQQIETDAASSLLRLKNILSISPQTPFELALGDLKQSWFIDQAIKESVDHTPLELQLKNLGLQLTTKSSEYQQARHYPTLYLTANLGTTAGKPNTYGPDTQIGDLFKPERLSYTIGLSLEWQLFTGFRTTATAHKALAEARKTEIQLQKLNREEQVKKQETYNRMQSALVIQQASTEAVTAMELAYKQSQSDFKAGTLSLTQLLEVQKDYENAQKSAFESYVNRILAAVEFRIAHGLHLYQ